MYTVIGSRATRAVRVLWMLEELGQPYDHVPARPRSDEARALNPAGKVPLLKVGDDVLSDSVAIMTYLADHHGALTRPAGTLDRARQDSLTHMILDEIEGPLWMAAKHSFVLPEEHRVPAVKASLKWEVAQAWPRLEAALQGPFLMGEKLTVPDLLLTHCLGWAERAGCDAPGERLQAYRARLEAREAYQRVAALP